MRIASEHPLAYRQGGWLHRTGFTALEATGADLRPSRINQSLNSPIENSFLPLPLAPVSERHKAISGLLARLD
jgi:hypothetical protein